MIEAVGPVNLVLLPIALGLLGFIEPCSMGTNLLFLKHVEGRGAGAISVVGLFTVTRGLAIGALGAVAAFVGVSFINAQRTFWLVLGLVYLALGAIYIAGKADILMRRLGPGPAWLSASRGTIGLGLLFALNIPACAAPLLFVLFGTTAAGAETVLQGFLTLALFGLALSLPLLVAVLFTPMRRGLDRLAGISSRIPLWTGLVLVALGLWSAYFGLFVDPRDWT